MKHVIWLAAACALMMAGCGRGDGAAVSYFDEISEAPGEALEGQRMLLTHSFSTESPVQAVAEEFRLALEEAGGPAVDLYPDNTLGNMSGGFEAVVSGTVDLRIGGGGGELMTILSWLPSYEEVSLNRLREELKPGTDLYKLLEEDYRIQGVHLLGVMEPEYRLLTSNRRIEGLEDLAGLRLRVVSGNLDRQFWGALGAETYASYPVEQLYTALQMGLVDAEENPLASICDRKFYEQQKYLVETNLRIQINTFFINLETWNGFSEEEKQIFQAAADRAVAKGDEASRDQAEVNEKLVAEHMEVIPFPEKEREKIRGIGGKIIRNEIIRQYGDEMLGLVREIVNGRQ